MMEQAVTRARKLTPTVNSCLACHSRLLSDTEIAISSMECWIRCAFDATCCSVACGKI